jgi:hypothetical protein
MLITGSAAAAANAAIGNVAQHVKAVPDQVNSLVSKHAPVVTEADMKRCKLDDSARTLINSPPRYS